MLHGQYQSSRVFDIPSGPHLSSEHIVMVMALCEEVHFHLSTSLIIPFPLSPPKKKKNLPHLLNQARQIPPLNPPLFPGCFPHGQGGEAE